MPTDKLTDTAIRKAKAGDKPRKLGDGGGCTWKCSPAGRAGGA